MTDPMNFGLPIKLIKILVKNGQYQLTEHALIRMEERNITEAQIEECIIWGQVLNIQDHGRDIKLKIKSRNNDVFVIVTAQFDRFKRICTIVITCAHTLTQLDEDWNEISAK
ncbi:MAG: DUF4258 domain-containing protein [Bacillota bacterium]|nr:DUF4258 domain-containing protein [Bacillota bacterium]